jgi:DNA-binding MarR family transcriptional regulator
MKRQEPLTFDPIAEAVKHWESNFGPALAPALAAVISIMRAQQIFLTQLNRLLAPCGLNFARYEALMLLTFSRQGSLSLGKMGQRLQVHPTTITNIIDKLEEDGLVERVPHPTDRRAAQARLTHKGRATGQRATSMLLRSFSVPLTDEELNRITKIIGKFRLEMGEFVSGSKPRGAQNHEVGAR